MEVIPMTKILTRIKLSEVSTVDKAANPGAQVLLVKRDHDGTPIAFGSREALAAAANHYCETVAKANSGKPLSEYEEYRNGLFTTKPSAPVPPAAVPVNKAYNKLVELGEAEAARHPGMTDEQGFMLMAERHPDLFAKAKAPPQDEDEDSDSDGDDDADEDGE